MTTSNKIKFFIAITFCSILNIGCKNENHIDKYKVCLDSLKTLPDNFYAFRRGQIYLEDINLKYYRIWFNTDEDGNVQDIYRIEDFKNSNSKPEEVVKTYNIDTLLNKAYAQKFIDLSRRFKLGSIHIDKINKISFSYKDGVAEQYIKALNDSIYQLYRNKKNFRLLKNGWFKNLE